MSIVVADRVKETTSTSGVADVVLDGAYSSSHQTFNNGIGNGNATYYTIENGSNWEVGSGVYVSSSNTLTRVGVLASSNSNAKISLTGVSIVFCTYPADKSVYKDERSYIDLSSDSGILLNNARLSYSGAYIKDVYVSGSLTYESITETPIKLLKTTSGNFFHAKDDSSGETLALHTDAQLVPTWTLGLKSSDGNKYAPPTYAYIYATDGAVGIVGDSSNKVIMDSAASFAVTHHGIDMITANYSTGVHINSTANAYPALIVNGGASLSSDIQQWKNYAGTTLSIINKDGKLGINRSSVNYDLDVQGSGRFVYVFTTSGIMFADGTLQTTAVSGSPSAISGWAGSTISTTGAAVSGWADYRDTQVSGWAAFAVAQISGTNYTAGSGMVLQGSTFHASNTFASNIVANSASGTAISGWSSSTIGATGAAVSGWANYRDAQISGWSSVNSASGDTAVSGYAATTISTTGAAISGWANYRDTQISGWSSVNSASGDTAVSGYAATTISTTGINISGWANYRVTQVSGWSAVNSASGDTAISGWVNGTVAATSGWANYRDLQISGWSSVNSASGDAAVSGYSATTISTTGAAVSGWADYRDTQVSGWAAYAVSQVSGGGGTTYSAGSGLVLQGTTFHAVNTFAAEILANSASGAAISGWANYRDAQVSGWSSVNSASGDLAVSGFASTTISTTGINISGWAGYYIGQASGWSSVNAASGDTAVSGYAATTISTTGAAVSGWANYRDTQISGWSSVNSASGDLAVSGYAATTISTTGINISGWADYKVSATGAAVSGWAGYGINQVSGWSITNMASGDSAVSGYAATTISATGAAVSGWSNYNAGVLDTAISGWASSTITATGASISGWAGSTIGATGAAVSGWADYRNTQTSGWTNFTFQRVEEKNVHIQGTLNNMSFNLINKALTQKRLTVLNGLKTTSGVGFVGIYIDGSGVTGLTSLYATPTQTDNTVAAGSGLIAVNNKVTVVISGVSSAVDLQFTLGMIPA